MSRLTELIRWYIRVSPIESRKRALGRIAERSLDLTRGPQVCGAVGGVARLELDFRLEYDRAIYLNLVDRTSLCLLRRLLGPGDIFVDAGANIGLFTVIAAHLVGEHGSVIAFEPQPEIAARLERNVALNHPRRVKVVRMGLWDSEGEKELNLFHGYGACRASMGTPDKTTVRESFKVQTVRLDDVVAQPVRLIKMDVEGADFHALRGASRLLGSATPPHLILELNDRATRAFGDRAMEMIRWLLTLRPFRLAMLERKRIQPVTLAGLDRWVNENPDDYCDVWLSPV